jgi:cytochrome c-type biogenesis protein CcmH
VVARAPAAAETQADAAPAGQGEAQAPTPEQVAAMVETLSQRLKDRPDDAQGWTMLARAYAALGRNAEAVPAFQKAVSLNTGDAGLLADYADTLAVQNDRQLNGEPLKLVERALKIEPGNLKALALAGTAAFDRKDFAGAVKYWEQLKQGVPADSTYLGQVQAGIDEARQLGKLPPSAKAPVTAPDAAGGNASIFAPGSTVSGRVTLAKALAGQAGPDDTVFVFARAAEGSRMPLAILRKQVKDLPFDFQLDDSMAMSPAAKLSGAPSVIVGARVSKTGEAMPQNGDLTGQSAPVAPGATGLKIEIGEVVKK